MLTPFGAYVPGSSFAHRLDARMKLLVMAAYAVSLFLVDWAGMLLCLLALPALCLHAAIPARCALRGIAPVSFILAFTLLANALTLQASDSPQLTLLSPGFAFTEIHVFDSVALFGGFGVSVPGLSRGLIYASRIVCLVAVANILSSTTSMVALTDAAASLMSPLRLLKAPVEDIAMMFSIALRFIPLMAAQAEEIIVAQAVRGAQMGSGGVLRRARAWIPVMVPLFVSLFRHADDLAMAMDSRCYTGGGRTRLRRSALRPAHILAGLALSACAIGVGIFL
jgi:energy-coupling factor transport system permease protein